MRALTVSTLLALTAGSGLLLSACGFQPLYAPASIAVLENVTVAVTGGERLSYLTETALMERVGTGGERPGNLTVTLRTAQVPLGVSADGQATRVALNIRARYELRDAAGSVSGLVNERVVFETPREPYALVAARANAEQRAAEVIADAVVRDALTQLHARQRGRPDVTPAPASGSGTGL